jgi:hypothetical protein
MSPEREDATRTALIGNLMLTLKHGDARRTAAGLLALAQVLVEDDPDGRIALAEIGREMASELESGIGQPPQPPQRFPRPKFEARSSVVQFAKRQ